MKKPTKSRPANKVQTPRGQRHTADKGKPVTIDLKAEDVADKKPSAAPKPAAKSDTANATQKTTSRQQKSVPGVKKSASGFGRESTPPKEPPVAKTDTKASPSGPSASSSSSSPPRSPSPSSPPSPPSPQMSNKEPRKKNKSGGIGGRLVAALIGGCVAIGGAGLLQYAGVLGSPSDTSAAFQQKLDTQSKQLSDQINDLKSQLADNTKGIAQLQNSESPADTEDIVTQVNETTLRVEQLMIDQKTDAETISKLEAALRTVSASSGGGGSAAVSALGLQVDNLSSQSTRLRDEIKQLKSELAALPNTNFPSAPSVDPQVDTRLSALETQTSRLSALSATLEDLQSRLASGSKMLEEHAVAINQLKVKQDQPNAAEKLAARSVAAAALKNDIDRGLPFANSLGVLNNLSGNDSSLAKLDDFATSGIPTSSQLSTSFQSVGEAIILATEPEPENDLTSRLLAGVKSFVKVKARKPIEGSTPLAIVSRISEALKNDDLPAASVLWASLPEAGRTVSVEWHNQLHSRIIAEELISNSVQSFLSSTATQ